MTGGAIRDYVLETAISQVCAATANAATGLRVDSFFDEATNTASHVVWDAGAHRAAVVDSVLDYDLATGRTSTKSADRIIAHAQKKGLTVDWLLETHVHADHLTAAKYLQQRLGGKIAIGRGVTRVQSIFAKLFNTTDCAAEGSEFDRLFDDGDRFAIGDLHAIALHAPGHTPADVAYMVGGVIFAGDTIFMPDWGTPRTDFPGADARYLYRSIRRLLSFPDETRLFLCHDYKPAGRDVYKWETTVGDERTANVHVRDGVAEDDFVAMRTERDARLPAPRLLFPSLQANLRGGSLPDPEPNGTRYLKVPLNAL
jgi:glyoxylase-like metal-dependent hydrolase (beta-lactamase superfamily II)